jgi:hypothetical protein
MNFSEIVSCSLVVYSHKGHYIAISKRQDLFVSTSLFNIWLDLRRGQTVNSVPIQVHGRHLKTDVVPRRCLYNDG